MRLVTSDQMRRLDARTIALGTPSIELMERAGKGVAERLAADHEAACKRGVLILVGAGNNGGDGFVIARHLAARRFRVRVALVAARDRVQGDAATNLERWTKRRGRLIEWGGAENASALRTELAGLVSSVGVVVDCVFGTGLARPVEGVLAEAFDTVNQREATRGRRALVAAVDLPSGLDGDRGEPLGTSIRADVTYTLGAVKLGLALPVAAPWVGRLELVEIGLAEQAIEEEAPLAEASTAEVLRSRLPVREAAGHKGTHGHLLLVAGAPGTSGAAVLAGRSALRAGAGLVTVACPGSVQSVVAGAQPELMTSAVEGFSSVAWEERLERKSALVVGPGIGTDAAAGQLVRWLLRRASVPILIDADGLTVLGTRQAALRRAHGPVILTPHPGEMARLTGVSTAEVQTNRRRLARELARDTGAVVVLKGSGTLIAAPDGRLGVNPTGGPILGTAGTGDVLAGLIGSLLAQGVEAWEAARLGAYLHGRAGDRVAARIGPAGLLASELADELPLAREELRAGV